MPAPSARDGRGLDLRAPAALAALASLTVSAVFIARAGFIAEGARTFSLCDDAMISMRYAQNLATGHGLVWNPGAPAVEGYTNLLWTLWMAALHLVPVPERLTSLLVAISGALIVAATAVVSGRLAARLCDDRPRVAAALAGVAVGLCFPLLFWTLRGMEVGLLTLVLVVAVELALQLADRPDARLGGLVLCLATLTLIRPDGLVPAIAIAVLAAASCPAHRVRTASILCGVPLAVLAILTVWRMVYYGAPLPNTYYLKMTGAPIAERLMRGAEVITTECVRYLPVAFALTLADRRLYNRWARAMVLLVPSALVAYAAYVGGDAWEWMPLTDRYVTPGLALLIPAAVAVAVGRGRFERVATAVVVAGYGAAQLVAASHSVSAAGVAIRGTVGLLAVGVAAAAIRELARGTVSRRWNGVVMAAATAALVATTSGWGYLDWVRTGGGHVTDDAVISRVGMLVRDSTSPDARIAVTWAGAIPYFAHREAIDLLGKNDPIIARAAPATAFVPGHNKYDYAYSIGQLKPDLIVQLWEPTPALYAWLEAIGYSRVAGNTFVRRDTRAVDVARLAAGLGRGAIP